MTASRLFDQGFQHHQAGRLGDAERLYREALAADGDHIHALHMLGVLAYQLGKSDIAIGLMGRSLAIDPKQPACHYNFGVALQALRREEEAIRAYGAAIRLAPNYAEAHSNLGTALQNLGRLDEAAREYAIAVRLKPDYPDAQNNFGSALARLGRQEEALAAYETAIRLKPDYAQAYANAGLALQSLGRFAEAADRYGAAARLKPNHAEAIAQQLYCLRQICDWRETGRLEQELLAQTDKYSPFMALIIDSSPAQQLAAARIWAEQHASIAPLPKAARPAGAKIRLGYLSVDFCHHAVAQLIVDLIERHDRERFDIIGYSYGPDDGSPLRQRLVEGFDRFVDIRPLSNLEAAQLIRRDGIDILIDLTGYTANARTEILAYRPAPVQVNFLGYPGTMGAGFIDWIIADPICIPPEDDAFFSEKIIRLDCYQPNDSRRQIAETPSRAACGLPEQGVVYCCFNNGFKITPTIFALWMRVLGNVPGSVLWLLDSNQAAKDNLRREASSAGIAAERLIFAPRLSLPEHLARHRLADLFLDTLPYNAHTTCSDALWMGLPVLTRKGRTFASRVAASLLTAVGLEEMAASSLADYEALASDPARFPAIRAKLTANLATAPLFDGARFARGIEIAYEQLLAAHG